MEKRSGWCVKPCLSGSSLGGSRRKKAGPVNQGLIDRGDLEQHVFPEVRGDQHQADRQTLEFSARDAECRVAGQGEGSGVVGGQTKVHAPSTCG